MKSRNFLVLAAGIFCLITVLLPKRAFAQACYGSRIVYQHYCDGGGGTQCMNAAWKLSGPGQNGSCNCPQLCDESSQGSANSCTYSDEYGNQKVCSCTCTTWQSGNGGDCVHDDQSTLMSCTSAANGCHIDGNSIPNCGWDGSGNCVDSLQSGDSFLCWGPGTPTPVCGNGICESGETCSTCSGDCGNCNGGGGGGSPSPGASPSPGSSPPASSSPLPSSSPSPLPSGCVITPNTPTGLTPGSGSVVAPDGSGNLTLGWNAQADATSYAIRVYPTGTAEPDKCTAVNTHCNAALAAPGYTFALDTGVSAYTWDVTAYNTGYAPLCRYSSPATATFTVSSRIAGNLYLVDDGGASVFIDPITNKCISGVAYPGFTPEAGDSITGFDGSTTRTGTFAGTNYTIDGLAAYTPSTVTYNRAGFTYELLCPVGGSYAVTTPSTNVDFYFTSSRNPWWQTINGLFTALHSSSVAIQSKIPATCVGPTCIPALSRKDAAGTADSEGYAISGGGSIDSTADTGTTDTYLREDGQASHIQGITLQAPQENYAYFASVFSLGATPVDDITSGGKPAGAPVNGRAYFQEGNWTIDTAWTVAAGESYVIFVHGNVTVTQPITVTEGGFLAVISSGHITFDKSLGQANPTKSALADAVVQGVFIADGQIVVESDATNEKKFIGAGSFVGWGGVQLKRQFKPTDLNNLYPTELFIYRPDFILHLPERMKRSLQSWQETNL